MRHVTFAPVLAALLLQAGCETPAVSSNPVLIDPTDTSGHSGGTDDIYDATQQAIRSLQVNENVRQHLEAGKGKRVVLNKIENKSGIPGYDENIIYNRFLASLTNSAGGRFIFINRNSAKTERDLQLAGQVKTSGVDAVPAGADLILDIQLLNLPSKQTNTIQYTFSLTNLADELLWTDSFEIKKRT